MKPTDIVPVGLPRPPWRRVHRSGASGPVRAPVPDRRLVRAVVASLPIVLAVGALAFVFADLRPRTYEATARVVVAAAPTPDDVDQQVIDSVSALANRRFLATYVDIVASAVVQRTAVAAALVPTADADEYTVATAVWPGSSAVDVRVGGPDPDRAAAVARNVVEEAGTTFEDFYPVFAVRVVDQPVAAREPAGPPATRAALAAATLTFVLWLAGVAVLHARPAPVRDAGAPDGAPRGARLVVRQQGA